MSILNFTYVVGTPEGVEVFTERHEAVLVTDDEYREAFEAAGLEVERDEQGSDGPRPLDRPAPGLTISLGAS